MYEAKCAISSSESSGWVRWGARNMKSIRAPSAAIFFMTYFHRARGDMAPSDPWIRYCISLGAGAEGEPVTVHKRETMRLKTLWFYLCFKVIIKFSWQQCQYCHLCVFVKIPNTEGHYHNFKC